MKPNRPDRGDGGDGEADQQSYPARDPGMCILGDLGIVVAEADQPEGDGHEKHHPDIADIQPRPEERRCQKRAEDQHAAHGRRAGLGGEVAFGAIIADGLAVFLFRPEQVDERTSEEEAEDQRGEEGAAGAEGDIAEKVEDIPAIGKGRKPV